MGGVSRSRVCYIRAATSSLDFPQNIWMLSICLVSFVFFFDIYGAAGAILQTLSTFIILDPQYFLQKKKRQIIHILWISVLPPPPLSTLAEVNNIHTKEFFYPHSVTPPPSPLSTFIEINDIF